MLLRQISHISLIFSSAFGCLGRGRLNDFAGRTFPTPGLDCLGRKPSSYPLPWKKKCIHADRPHSFITPKDSSQPDKYGGTSKSEKIFTWRLCKNFVLGLRLVHNGLVKTSCGSVKTTDRWHRSISLSMHPPASLSCTCWVGRQDWKLHLHEFRSQDVNCLLLRNFRST